MKKYGVLLAALLGLAVVGCSGGSDFNENYSTDVKLSEEQKAKRDANMAGQQAPGSLTPGQPATGQPGGLKLPPGKGGSR